MMTKGWRHWKTALTLKIRPKCSMPYSERYERVHVIIASHYSCEKSDKDIANLIKSFQLSVPMMSQFTDAYMLHSVLMSWYHLLVFVMVNDLCSSHENAFASLALCEGKPPVDSLHKKTHVGLWVYIVSLCELLSKKSRCGDLRRIGAHMTSLWCQDHP